MFWRGPATNPGPAARAMHTQESRMFLKRHKGYFVEAFFFIFESAATAIGSPRSIPASHTREAN